MSPGRACRLMSRSTVSPRRVRKVNVPELDLAAQRFGAGALIGLRRIVEDFENALPCGASRLKELVKLVQAPDRFVEEAGKHEERHQDADIHLLMEHAMRAEAGDEQHAARRKKVHGGTVDRPRAHDDEGRLPKRFAGCIETRMLALFAGVGLDLPDPRDVVVKKRVEG